MNFAIPIGKAGINRQFAGAAQTILLTIFGFFFLQDEFIRPRWLLTLTKLFVCAKVLFDFWEIFGGH